MKQAFNPFLPGYEYIPDGEPHVFGDRIYIFGSHDAFDGGAYCVNDYVCWSAPTTELGSWRYEGIIYRKEQDPGNRQAVRSMFAPDVAQGPDGRYYLYYTLDLKGEAGTLSVAVSDSPAGPYEYYGCVKDRSGHIWGSREGEILNYDPAVFVDDDQRVYLYSGIAVPEISGLKKRVSMLNRKADGAYGVELERDMLTMRTEPVRIFGRREDSEGTEYEGHAFFEASSMRKINGKYYFIYCSEKSHELCYGTGDDPLGKFRYGGTLVSIGDVGYRGRPEKKALNYLGNTHGSIEKIGKEWFVFYHRHTNLDQFSRQACAERLEIDEYGNIEQAELTSCGLNILPLEGTGRYPTRIACNLRSAKGTETYGMVKLSGGEHPFFTQEWPDHAEADSSYIANIKDGSSVGFKYFDLQEPEKIKVTVRGNADGVLIVTTAPGEPGTSEDDLKASDVLARLRVMPGDEWHEVCGEFDKTNGETGRANRKQALYFFYFGSGALDWKDFMLS